MVLVYCDPKDEATYNSVLDSMCKARKQIPINLKVDEEGDFTINREKDFIFILSENPSLFMFKFDKSLGPQAFVVSMSDSVDLLKDYLPNLKIMDDIDKEEWLAKAENAEKEFEIKPEDN